MGTRDEIAVGERETESLVRDEQLMEEVGSRENLRAALRQVMSNRGSAGGDGRGTEQLPSYLKAHGPEIREQLFTGQY